MDRRSCLQVMGSALGAAALHPHAGAQDRKFGFPGAYRGRVVVAEGAASVQSGKFDAATIRSMIQKGMCELTGAPAWQDAWKQFFGPGDVVGIKLNPVGHPVYTGPETLAPILEGITSTGVKASDIVVYDPVAVDRIGWAAIDARRAQQKLPPVALNKPDGYGATVRRQPEHIIAAGKLGLGEWETEEIDLRKVKV